MRFPRIRRWMKVLAGVAAVLLLLALVGSWVAGRVFRHKLEAAVHDQLHAELESGSVFYRPPYTFVTRDIRLVRNEPGGRPVELLSARRLRLKLDRLPHKGSPMLIRELALDQPVIHWVKSVPPSTVPTTPETEVRKTAQKVENESQKLQRSEPPKFSERFRIDHLRVTDARLLYDNLASKTEVRIGDAQLAITETHDPAVYDLEAMIDHYGAASVSASALLNVDTQRVEVRQLAALAELSNCVEALPVEPSRRERFKSAVKNGKLIVRGTAELALADLSAARFQGTIDLENGAFAFPRWQKTVNDVAGHVSFRDDSHAGVFAAVGRIESFRARAGASEMEITAGNLSLAGGDQGWRIANVVGRLDMGEALPFSLERSGWFFDKADVRGPIEFTAAASGPLHGTAPQSPLEGIRHTVLAYPHGVSLQPRNFPRRLEHITGGPVTFTGGVVSLRNLSAAYGGDSILLRSARLTLEDPARKIPLDHLRRRIAFEEIAGTLNFREPELPYPGVIGKVVAQLRPHGPFVVGGGSWYAVDKLPEPINGKRFKPDFLINLMADGGSFVVSKYHVPLSDLHGRAVIRPKLVDITDLTARTLGGTLAGSGQIVPGKPFQYHGAAQLRDIDLRQVGETFPFGEKARARLNGQGFADATIAGESSDPARTAARKLVLQGEFQVLHGDFRGVPTLSEVSENLRRPDELGTADAAGVVHIADELITIDNGAVNAPLLGLQASGTIGFDKSVDLDVTAAPLGDWRDRLRQAHTPVVSDVAADIAGAVQKLINGAQGALLYQLRVSGNLSHPVVSLVPAPAITEPVALLFGQMLRPDAHDRLLTTVRGATSRPTTKARPGTRP